MFDCKNFVLQISTYYLSNLKAIIVLKNYADWYFHPFTYYVISSFLKPNYFKKQQKLVLTFPYLR